MYTVWQFFFSSFPRGCHSSYFNAITLTACLLPSFVTFYHHDHSGFITGTIPLYLFTFQICIYGMRKGITLTGKVMDVRNVMAVLYHLAIQSAENWKCSGKPLYELHQIQCSHRASSITNIGLICSRHEARSIFQSPQKLSNSYHIVDYETHYQENKCPVSFKGPMRHFFSWHIILVATYKSRKKIKCSLLTTATKDRKAFTQ